MTKGSEFVYHKLINNEKERIRGEISSKTGKNYEDIASFFIISRFNKLTKAKSKIKKISFNGLEDLDIFDDNNRIFSFQIKKRKSVWTKSDKDQLKFLKNCINRFLLVDDLKKPIEIKYYFFSNITGNFMEKWKKLHKSNFKDLKKKLPANFKRFLENKRISETKIKQMFSNIFFLTSKTQNSIKHYLDQDLFKKFKELKENNKSGQLIDYIIFSDDIFHEERLKRAFIDEPAREYDQLISNILEVEIRKKTLFYAPRNKKKEIKNIQSNLKKKKVRICYLYKYGNIYCFHEFSDENPLTEFIDKKSKINTIELNKLEDRDIIWILNDCLYHYLNNIGLKYYRRKANRYFYFFSKGRDKKISWYDFNTRTIKKWPVVIKSDNFYKNLAAKIRFKRFQGRFILIINPRLLFTSDGIHVLKSNEISRIERSFRKSFMKNDFLRRRFNVIISYIKKEIPKKNQLIINRFLNEKENKRIGKDNWKFWDENLIKFKNLINLEADFKPNIEAKNIPLEQKTIGDEENESVTSKGSQTIIQRWKCLRSLSRVN